MMIKLQYTVYIHLIEKAPKKWKQVYGIYIDTDWEDTTTQNYFLTREDI